MSIKQGTILHGRVRVTHTGTDFKVVLPDVARSAEQVKNNVQAHFWRGFWYALADNCESADFHFAIALAYFNQPVEQKSPITQRSGGLHKYA